MTVKSNCSFAGTVGSHHQHFITLVLKKKNESKFFYRNEDNRDIHTLLSCQNDRHWLKRSSDNEIGR